MKFSTILITFLSVPGIHVANASFVHGPVFQSNTRRLHASEVASHPCVGESYDLSLVITGAHVGLAAEPECLGSANKECECPSLFFHAPSVAGEGVQTQFLEKEIVEVDPKGDDQERLELGSFQLGTVVEAFENASMEETEYDLLLNNCAGLSITMLRDLGIDATDRNIITFAARQLSKSDFIINEMSKSDFGVEDFVSAYVHDRF